MKPYAKAGLIWEDPIDKRPKHRKPERKGVRQEAKKDIDERNESSPEMCHS